MGQPVTYFQSRMRAIGVIPLGIVLVASFASLVLPPRPDLVVVVLSVVAVVIALIGIWREWRESIIVAQDGVVVRNQLRDHHLRWDEITGAECRAFPRSFQPGGVFLVLTNGDEVRCHAFGDGPLDDVQAAQRVLNALNARLVTTP